MNFPTELITSKLKEYGPKVVVLLAVGAAGVAIGWQMKPSQVKIEEKIKVVEVTKEVVVVQEKVRVEVVHVKDTQVVERYHKERTETKSPDGTVAVKEVVDKNIDSHTQEHTNTVEVKVVEVEKQVVVKDTQIIEKKITPEQTTWHMGVLLGVNFTLLPAPTVSSYLVGAEVERRIIGPFYGGLWVMGSTTGQAIGGAKLAVDF